MFTLGYDLGAFVKECFLHAAVVNCSSLFAPYFHRRYGLFGFLQRAGFDWDAIVVAGKCFASRAESWQTAPSVGLSLLLDIHSQVPLILSHHSLREGGMPGVPGCEPEPLRRRLPFRPGGQSPY